VSPAVITPPSLAAFVAAPAVVLAGERPRPSAVVASPRITRLGEEARGRGVLAAAEEEVGRAAGGSRRVARRAGGDEVAVAFGDGGLLYLAQRLAQEGTPEGAADGAAAQRAYTATAVRGRIEYGLEDPIDLMV